MTYNNRSMSGRATMWERRCKKIAGMRDSTLAQVFCVLISRAFVKIRRANCNNVSNFIAKESNYHRLKDKDAVELMKLHKELD